ncbi:MAG: Trm112 family protein [Sphingobacteriia bacterium]|nr:Trm112 family protein [Sphingobacteriia bacterium]NCC41277.1 Trm112 family protein [Gammaproteobacteria bacterium]
MLDKHLLDILVCPVTKGSLILDKERGELISVAAQLAYPIRDDIPVMLEEEARPLSAAELEQYREQGSKRAPT